MACIVVDPDNADHAARAQGSSHADRDADLAAAGAAARTHPCQPYEVCDAVVSITMIK